MFPYFKKNTNIGNFICFLYSGKNTNINILKEIMKINQTGLDLQHYVTPRRENWCFLLGIRYLPIFPDSIVKNDMQEILDGMFLTLQ